ncbi:four-helix bundle copper-binding protein [Tuwongella immobilis]|uniref:Ferredoxin n=1 Tax=Tuwongella immobilis TaxID=692036 RepID=A0A6C2YTP9_9BACT|nr:four-helix bundle copper-binding protein [Tuwongella immobilis]VIP04794.1 Uncharacterized protein OS=Acinetobacter schindleri NIPH 900 GN=F965_02932 PE=4 SV=1 [Tuwongella immobilis]VTS06948.1 Uncharacterized protein OS=Acinetobacter schindleri NIPH 900 GN=F965_02932 PE=4 SV=1 [Tuwongella immobilis]
MSRRSWLGLVAIAMLVPVIGSRFGHAAVEADDPCARECAACSQQCQACAADCLDEVGEGKTDRRRCVQLCLDCSDICGACAKIAARGGPLESVIASACATACDQCAAECAKHRDDATCQACAAQCRKCAAACRAAQKK